MQKRERLERTLLGDKIDRLPVALWRYFPGDDIRSADLARSIVDFQKQYDWDFVRVTPSNHAMVLDYGLADEWNGEIDGKRSVSKRVIQQGIDWTRLRTLEPLRGEMGKQLECLRLILQELKATATPVIMTVDSPLSQAGNLAGNEVLLYHLRLNPDLVRSGLNILTESTLRFIEALRRLEIDGIFYRVNHASYDVMSAAEYQAFGMPYDYKVLESMPAKWWLNVLQVRGNMPILKLFSTYPIQAMNWHVDSEDILAGYTLTRKTVCTGLHSWEHIHQGTPSILRDVIRECISKMNRKPFILSSNDEIFVTSPLSNLRAVREIVETMVL